jgi:hypothetical protein
MSKKIKKKKKVHVTYNKKVFLAPDSILSMSAIHTKILSDGTAILRISDCNNSVRIWNDLNDKDQVKEMVTKITSIQNTLEEFKKGVKIKLEN